MDENEKQQIEAKEQAPFKPPFMIDLQRLQGSDEEKKKAVEEFRHQQAEYYNKLDAALIEKAVTSGAKYVAAIKEMREVFKKKFARCVRSPEDGIKRFFPYVVDEGKNGILVAGGGNYALVTYTGYCYSIQVNQSMYVHHSPKTLDGAVEAIQDIIYGERW